VPRIDLNADVGEGVGDDAALLEVVTSANVACGFHAGDAPTIRRTCEAAVARGVVIGAHVGYRDPEHFGRRELDVQAGVLRDEALYQLGALDACAHAVGGVVRYVKPHGALYHRCSADPEVAEALVEAAKAFDLELSMVGAPGSALLAAAQDGHLQAVPEGFADRAYRPDGTLVPRAEPGAVIGGDAAVQQAVRLAADGTLGTLCVHGDSPDAVALARAVREGLETRGVTVAAFA
jgi:UPF0271 protein